MSKTALLLPPAGSKEEGMNAATKITPDLLNGCS